MAPYRRVRELRVKRSLTQKQVADMLGMPQPQYCRYEQGRHELPLGVLVSLAKLYGTSADYILELTAHPEPHN